MLTGSYVDLEYILEKVNDEKPSNAVCKEAKVKDWIADGLRKIGNFTQFDMKVVTLDMTDNRQLVPDGIINILAIKDNDSNVVLSKSGTLVDMGLDPTRGYYQRGRYLYTHPDITSVDIVYNCYVTDDKGRPMIPDNQYFISAITSYIVERLAWGLFNNGTMPKSNHDVYEREWLFYVRAASAEANMPTIADMATWDSLHNLVMMRSDESHALGYANLNKRENIRLHGNKSAA